MRDHDLPTRLRHLGEHPVPDATRDAHLRRMSAVDPVTPAHRDKRFGRLAVAAAALVGFFAGSTGLAMAGALPDPAQGAAHSVLSVVRIDVPDRQDNRGACVSEAARSTEDEAAKKAAIDACKTEPPGRSGAAPGRSGEAPGRSGSAGVKEGEPCKGKPPWAGPGKTAGERAALQEQHSRAGCPADEVATEADDAPGG